MPGASSSTLALAASLRGREDGALERMLRRRGIRTAGIADWFDLAEALLERASIQRALEDLDRPTLAVIAAAAELTASGTAPTIAALAERTGSEDAADLRRRANTAVEDGLLGEESGRYPPWDTVIDQLSAWPSFGLPSAEELIWTPPPAVLAPVDDTDRAVVDRIAGERAFATTVRVTEVLLELRRGPARLLAKGGIALPETRRLATAAAVDQDAARALLDLAERAGLIEDAAAVSVTQAGAVWLDRAGPERWALLALGWLARLPAEIRTVLTERSSAVWDEGLVDYLAWYYPAEGPAIRERIGRAASAAALLGITVDGVPSTPGRALLLEGQAAAASAMTGLFPAEVDRVYLQYDLSIVSPGPLAAALDARLRGMADAEARGLASTYRMSAASITRALSTTESADSMLDFLGTISLNGVPQPVEYLVRDTAERFGSLRVGPVGSGGSGGSRSYVRAADPALIAQLLVDQSLSALGLRAENPTRALSGLDPGVVYWTLLDARYPAVAEDAEGRVSSPSRRPAPCATEGADADPIADLVLRLRGPRGTESQPAETAWIARQLELAVRSRTPILVRVRMPDGSSSEFRLEPASVGGGRLRARDPRAGLERTLPLASITAVTALS